MHDDLPPPSPSVDSNGTVVLMLGLYLIILCFFVYLNAVSIASKEKYDKATESISLGFGFGEGRDVKIVAPPPEENPGLERVFEAVARDLRGLLESLLAVKDYSFLLKNDQMVLRLDLGQFFEPGSVRINPAQVEFFQDLATLIAQPRPGVYVATEVRVPAYAEVGSRMDRSELAGRRAAIFTRALIERGARPHQLTATASEGDDVSTGARMVLYFTIHIENAEQALKALRRARKP